MTTFSLIGIITADLAASRDFYRRLGLAVPDGEDHLELTLTGRLRLAWDTVEVIRSFDPDWLAPTGSGVALAFDCGTPAEVDRLHAELGHSRVAPFDAPWGQRYAVVHDPDGNAVDLFSALGAA